MVVAVFNIGSYGLKLPFDRRILVWSVFAFITIIYIILNRKTFFKTDISVNEGEQEVLSENEDENNLTVEDDEDRSFSKTNYSEIIHKVDAFVLVLDESFTPVYINSYGSKLLGDLYDKESPDIKKFIDEKFVNKLRTIEDDVFSLETTIEIKNKKTIATIAAVSKISNEEGEFAGMVILFNDISKQKRAELSLRNQISFSKQIFKTIPDVILITDMDLRVIFANKKAEQILSRSQDESRKIFNYLSQDAIANGFDEYLRQTITSGVKDKRINVKNPFKSEKGFADIEIVPLKSSEKTIGGLLLVKDITEWRSLTEDLKNLENFNIKMINSGPYAIISINQDDIVRVWNNRSEEMFGIESENILERRLFEAFPEIKTIQDDIYETRIVGKNTFLSDVEIIFKNGRNIIMEISMYPVIGRENNIVINIRDITHIKELENSLVHAKKMGSLGLLTSKIVHDLNNVLSGITGYTTLLDKKFGNNEEIKKYVGRLRASSDKAIEIIRQTLNYSKTNKNSTDLININRIIEETINMLRLRIGKDKLATELCNNNLIVKGDKTRFSQAIMNLLVNANDALQNRQEPKIIIRTEILENSKNVKITVKDNGIGIKKEVIEKIFDTYFTTKPEDKGTGLGLSNVRDIVKELKGEINVKSEYEVGTEFTIELPLVGNDIVENVNKKEELEQDKLHLDGKILLIDDEETVREIGVEILEYLGVKTITAIDGYDGIMKFKEYEEEIKIVILDVEMPKKQGDEVYDFIKKNKPEMKVLISSGYSKEYLEKDVFRRKIQDYMAKPFQLKELGTKIKEMINRG